MAIHIGRREFVVTLGGAVALPFGTHAQQATVPVIALINAGSADAYTPHVAAFRKGFSENGYVEGQNVAVEYYWLEGQYDRLSALMADLTRRQVAVIATPASANAALAVKVATATIPIVFAVAQEPVELGLVASLARPGAMRPASISSPARLVASGCGCCMIWCRRRVVLPCWSIQPILAPLRLHCGRCRKPRLPLDCKSKSSRPRRSTRLIPLLPALRANPRKPFSLLAMASSSIAACNLPFWRHATGFRRLVRRVSSSKLAG